MSIDSNCIHDDGIYPQCDNQAFKLVHAGLRFDYQIDSFDLYVTYIWGNRLNSRLASLAVWSLDEGPHVALEMPNSQQRHYKTYVGHAEASLTLNSGDHAIYNRTYKLQIRNHEYAMPYLFHLPE